VIYLWRNWGRHAQCYTCGAIGGDMSSDILVEQLGEACTVLYLWSNWGRNEQCYTCGAIGVGMSSDIPVEQLG
jgi:hypothetical protein